MDFDAFRKKKQAEEERLKKAKAANSRPMANGSKRNWSEGLGPTGPSNPKIKGFVLGRYSKKRIDPRTLEKPKGFQTSNKNRTAANITRRVECCNENVEPSVAIVQCHGCKKLYHPQCLMDERDGVCCEGRAVLLAPPPRPRSQKAIDEEKSRSEVKRPRGLTKY